LIGLLLAGGTARADPAATRDSLDRWEELLQLRLEDGRLDRADVMPALLVSTEPRYTPSEDWFAVRVIEVLQNTLGEGLRLCEACMAPRAIVGEGHLTYQTGPVGLDEVIRLDDQTRGKSAPARSAIWVDETARGIAVRIVDLRSGRVLYAQNIDPMLVEDEKSQRNFALADELERRARGNSITQSFVDLALYPGQHISLDMTEQWGETNKNLTGVTLSLVDPVVGIGVAHYRVVDLVNVMVGGKLILSLPTAVVRSFDTGNNQTDVIDPLVNAVLVVRVPFGRSNYGVVATASTNGTVGLGLSLMNVRFLPVIP
jgi:hypothetical protein